MILTSVIVMLLVSNEMPPSLSLVCLGSGSANKQQTNSVTVYGSDGSSAWGNSVGNRTVPFDDQVNVKIDQGVGTLMMPRQMLPPLRGGKDGWFKLKDLEFTDEAITASVAVNPLNNPKVRIDRFTGTISISGKSGAFVGECVAYDPSQAQRKF